MKNHTSRNSFLLFVTACIWGFAFVSQSKGMEYMHPFTFNGVRSLIGAVALFIYLIFAKKLTKENIKKVDWKITIKGGILCGIAITLGSTLQQFGLVYTSVGKAGFITTLYIIFVPIAGLFFGKKVTKIVWAAAATAAVGMYLLCMTESFSIGLGDTLVFLCAIAFAGHILVIDHYSPKTDGAIISCIQFAVCGIICMVGAFLWGNPTLSQITSGSGTLLYAGVMSCGVAYTLQIIGQKGINPTIAALILSLESVIATVAGYFAFKIGFLITDQTLTVKQMIGCIIVFSAVLVVQLPDDLYIKIRNR